MRTSVLSAVSAFFGGAPMAAGLLLMGAAASIRLRLFPVRRAKAWLFATAGHLRSEQRADGLSPRQAAAAALAATVGTGNIAGVAAAIALGGPGAVFWMWCSAVLGMATAYCENYLGIFYRTRAPGGIWRGGPMAYMERGVRSRALAAAYALGVAAASLGIGSSVQTNSIAAGLYTAFSVPLPLTGAACAGLALLVALGGVRRVGAVAERLVPCMVGLYVLAGCVCLAMHVRALPGALGLIFREAFSLRAGVSGAGCGMLLALKTGVTRGVFSNEAGLGTTVLVGAQAEVDDPEAAGMWAVFDVFVDTLVVCSMTALVILTSGVYAPDAYRAAYDAVGAPGGPLTGAALTSAAFSATFGPWGGRLVAVCLAAFAFSTVLTWTWYGRAAAEYVFGPRAGAVFLPAFALAVWAGSVLPVDRAWTLADIGNGLMAVPNLIAVGLLLRVVRVPARHEKAAAP